MTKSEAKVLLDNFIESWLTQDSDLFLSLLSDDIIYTECYGPVYSSKSECEKWFTEWNKESRVLQWIIKSFVFDIINEKIAFEWFFECNCKGTISGFCGSSFILVDNNHITAVNEYKTEPEHYHPYKTGRVEKEISTNFKTYTSFTIDSKWPDINALILLYKQTPWANNRTSSDISLLKNNSDIVVSVYDNTRLIGFGRIITDGKYRGLLDDIIVDEQYRLMGIGRNIVNTLLGNANSIKEVFLNTGKEHQSFYEKMGFKPFTGLTMVRTNS
jgi:N-acetylglutamate synthase-like GNAT family acetyltransferase